MDKQKILIVDDSEMNRALLIDILEEHYDVVEADVYKRQDETAQRANNPALFQGIT